EAIVATAFAVDAGLHHGLEMLLIDLGAGDEGRDLLLFLHLPVDIGLDIGVIGIDHHHLGGAAGGAARLDRAGGAVADLEEAHQAAGLAAAGARLDLGAQGGAGAARTTSVFNDARLAHPRMHAAAVADEVVVGPLDGAS